jgi:hypothetical protein
MKRQYIKIRSHLYLHCPNCNGVFLCEDPFRNPLPFSKNCPYCKQKIELADSYEHCGAITRFAAVIEKEEPMKKILKIVLKNKDGISGIKLKRMLNKWGYREKVIHQLICLGLIAETIDGASLYYITENGRRVLEVCKG